MSIPSFYSFNEYINFYIKYNVPVNTLPNVTLFKIVHEVNPIEITNNNITNVQYTIHTVVIIKSINWITKYVEAILNNNIKYPKTTINLCIDCDKNDPKSYGNILINWNDTSKESIENMITNINTIIDDVNKQIHEFNNNDCVKYSTQYNNMKQIINELEKGM